MGKWTKKPARTLYVVCTWYLYRWVSLRHHGLMRGLKVGLNLHEEASSWSLLLKFKIMVMLVQRDCRVHVPSSRQFLVSQLWVSNSKFVFWHFSHQIYFQDSFRMKVGRWTWEKFEREIVGARVVNSGIACAMSQVANECHSQVSFALAVQNECRTQRRDQSKRRRHLWGLLARALSGGRNGIPVHQEKITWLCSSI